MKVKEMFDIKYGKRNFYFKNQPGGLIPYISSTSKNRGVMGYVEAKDTFEDVITVPRNGSVCHSFYQKNKCVINDDCLVLTSKNELSEREKVFYSLVFRNFKNLFAYGRKVTPERLGELDIPEKSEIPSWVNQIKINDYSDIADRKEENKEVCLPTISTWRLFSYEELFEIKKAQGPTATHVKKNPGSVPYVTASRENNGISGYGDFEPAHKGNVLTVGHLADVFYQPNDFSGNNVTVCIPKFKNMNQQVGLFLVALMNKNKYKYNYGRVVGITRLKKETIKVPVDKDGNIDTELITRYMNSLSYSKYL